MNPLDGPDLFSLELMNPNPRATKLKDGSKYLVTFELHRGDWQQFMDADTAGMVIEMQGRVVPSIPKEEKPKGGKISQEAGMLCNVDEYNEYASHKWTGDDSYPNQVYANLKSMIYDKCNITSRAELDHNTEAAWKFNKLKSKMFNWCEQKKADDIRRAEMKHHESTGTTNR